MRSAVPIALLALGCSDGGNGTAVGNPGHLDVYVQNVPSELELSSALFRVAAIELVGCDRRDVAILQLDATFDALGPSPVEIPGGEWCQTVVLPAGKDSFLLEGFDGEGEPFMVGLSPQPFVLEGAYIIDGNEVFVALSLAEDADDVLNEATGAEDAEPPQQGGPAAFEPDLVVPDGLFTDQLDGAEGERGTLLASPSSSTGCAYSTGRPAGLSLILVAGILGWRRRR